VIEGTEVVCEKGAISTGPADAARIGARIFEQGGNAMDAAAAACLACTVLETSAVDLGGYVAAAVVLDGKTGQMWSVDANSVAPAAAHAAMYETLPVRSGPAGINELEYGCSVPDDANIYGPLSVGVPGFLAGVGTMSERWGKLKWSDVVAPSQALIDNGLTYGLVRESIVKKREAIERFASTSETLLPGGRVPDDDDPWPRQDLATTFARLAAQGWRDFYDGEIGRAIADYVLSQGGILTRGDMAAFVPRVTEPHSGRYRGAGIHTAVPPNGGFSVLSALDELQASEPGSDQQPAYWETMAGTLQRMWRRRLGGFSNGASPHGTVHIGAADAEGNLVSITISQGGLFGSCLAVPGTGIILAHGMCRFDPQPDRENSPASFKRPLNNVCPLIIRMPGRDVAIGVRGGRRIVSVCTQMAQRIVDFGATVTQAATAPRIHMLTGEPLEISHNFDPSRRDALTQMGHRIVVPTEVAGAAHGAEILTGTGNLRAGGNTWAAGI
jgi:gamma-glutamyltranspeptidase/glutathione hydrolase